MNPSSASDLSTSPSSADYAKDIRPLLSNACFACHGPDEENRQSGLRLDSFTDATEDLGGYRAIEPGDAEASEAWIRITSSDPDMVMPPPRSGKGLTDSEKELIRRWIEEGGEFAEHWAFETPKVVVVPEPAEITAAAKSVGDIDDDTAAAWTSNPIDRFVAEKMLSKDLSPSPRADRATLLRRLSLDLIGLPPTPEELAAFLTDDSPIAYGRQVDRLLASRHFGERWGRVWLDNARYADSDGFEKDKPRSVWFYRDWVARAMAEDMPYDQFVIKQIAGDLLPDPTQDDLVATGFLRNSMHNEEGGVDPEQFRMEAMYDRMDAIGKSVLGLTLQCAQCHSHKYDPISHTDYYRLFAMLNNCHESSITVFTQSEDRQRREVLNQIDQIHQDAFSRHPDLAVDFERFVHQQQEVAPETFENLSLDWIEETIGGQKYIPQSDGSYLQQGYAATKNSSKADTTSDLDEIRTVRLEVMRDPNLPHGGPGRSFDGTWALTDLKLYRINDAGESEEIKFASAAASIDPPRRRLQPRYWFQDPDPERVTGPVQYAIDGDEKTAWTGTMSPGRRNDPQVAFFYLADPIQRRGDSPIRLQVEMVVKHGGWNSDDNQSHNLGRFRIGVSPSSQPADTLPPKLRQWLSESDQNDVDATAEAAEMRRGLRSEFFRRHDSDVAKRVVTEEDAAWDRYPQGTAQLVVQERDQPRPTHRLDRGDFLSPKELVSGGTPGFLHPSDGTHGGNRLDLALWLVDRSSPTTARAIVNRIWQAYFGTGLTATVDDLGLQGEPPSHVELLDYLAVRLMDHGWSLKSLHRDIVSSQTYQQSSRVDDRRLRIDPANRWLSRGPRYRVPAEMVRDIALTAAGLLDPTVGGPPVFPKAPEFLFLPPASYGPKTWGTSNDSLGDNFRRGFYTFRFRSVPYPAYQAFDAPTGEVACVTRSRSNTPLQALVTLNEPLFLRCAIGLADTILQSDIADDRAGIERMFVRCVGRPPREAEMKIALKTLAGQRRRLAEDPAAAETLLCHAVDAPTPLSSADDQPSSADDPQIAATERAAWTLLSRVVLNLDETITKP